MQKEIDAVAEHCSDLRKLDMWHSHVDVEKLFAAVGPTLEYLTVHRSCSSLFLGHVKKYCPNLSVFKILDAFSVPTEDILNLSASYSSQLLKLSLPRSLDLSVDDYETIVRNCP